MLYENNTIKFISSLLLELFPLKFQKHAAFERMRKFWIFLWKNIGRLWLMNHWIIPTARVEISFQLSDPIVGLFPFSPSFALGKIFFFIDRLKKSKSISYERLLIQKISISSTSQVSNHIPPTKNAYQCYQRKKSVSFFRIKNKEKNTSVECIVYIMHAFVWT